jgi:Dinucleotide-utilizing enzymes involved in molybdopterin and thiamine biosynthesis family 2
MESARELVALSPAEMSRYSRHLALREIGIEGQRKLKAARVLVVGAGGLGSPASLYLAAAGVGTLGLIDNDRIDLSNLQRQVLYGTELIGQVKVEAARARLASLNPEIRIETHEVELRAANVMSIVAQYDLVLDGTDRFATRYLVNDACVLLGKPLVAAAIHRFEGQALTYVPGRGTVLPVCVSRAADRWPRAQLCRSRRARSIAGRAGRNSGDGSDQADRGRR